MVTGVKRGVFEAVADGVLEAVGIGVFEVVGGRALGGVGGRASVVAETVRPLVPEGAGGGAVSG